MKPVARVEHLVLLLWILLLSSLVWHKASMSDQLPITDAFEYYAKAKHFWNALHTAKPSLAFDAQPVFRPFGTVLMSYPFGFAEDPRPFYFRSVLSGIVALMIAVLIAVGDQAKAANAKGWIIGVAISASVLPMFFHFEASERFLFSPIFWGLVDGFFAGLAAVAAAAVVRAVASQSLGWTFVAILVSAYSILVKPTGAVIMMVTAIVWFSGMVLAWWRRRDKLAGRQSLFVLVAGSLSFVLVFGAVAWWCSRLQYLSGATVAFGSNAMTTLQADWGDRRSWEVISNSLYPCFGVFFPLALLLPPISLVISNRLPGNFWRTYAWHVVASVMTLFVGLWLWIVTSNATQVRYFLPFALAALIFALPPLQLAFSLVASPVKKLSVLMFGIPVVATTTLLAFSDIPTVWQERLGVNLQAGPVPAEGRAAERLLEDVRSSQKSGATVYDLTSGSIASRVLASRAQFEHLVRADKASFELLSATDWISPSVVKLREIIDADYILAAPPTDSSRLISLSTDDINYESEASIFDAWGRGLGAKDGVVALDSDTSFRLYKVQDRGQLERSLESFKESRKWRVAFLEQNPAYWWSRDQLESILGQGSVAVRNVVFGSIYRIEAVRIRKVDGVVVVDIWWSGVADRGGVAPDRMFLHLQDSKNRIAHISASWLHARDPLIPSMTIRLSTFRFAAAPGEAMTLAFGIYDDAKKFLLADSGNRDWGNQRVVLPVPP